MATQMVGHSYDSPKWTVAQLVKKPAFVPNLVKNLVADSNLSDWLLRPGPTAVGGAVVYEEKVELYADSEGEIVAEFGEIPGTMSGVSTPMTRATTKRGVHIKISQEMVDRNDVGRVRDEIEKARRSLVLGRDRTLINTVLTNPNILTMPAGNLSGGWVEGTSSIIADIAAAQYEISSQSVPSAQYSEVLGYDPDIMIIHPSLEAALIDNEKVNAIFAGSPMADQQLRFTGKLPKKFLNLNVMKSWRCPVDKVFIAQRNYMGFISKEKALQGTPLRHDEDTESYRCNFSYRELVAIDNPKAVIAITGVADTP